MRTQSILATLSVLILGSSLLTMSGCSVWNNRPRLREQKISMNEPVYNVPPVMLEILNDQHLLIMQAPNSGWSILINRDELIPGGKRLFITVRRPDPAFMYPQAIVEKRLLTDIHADIDLEVYVRLLGADQKTKGLGFGKLTPVDHFEE